MQNFTKNELSFEIRLITCIFYLISSLIGVTLYIFDMYVMYKHRDIFNNTFYILVRYCAVGDIVYLLMIILYIVPFSIANEFFIPEKIAIALGNGDSFFFNTIFVFLGPVALNRFMAITGAIYPKFTSTFTYKLFVHKKYVHMLAIGCWIYGIGISVALDVIADCPKVFSLETMTFGYNCADFGHPLFRYYANLAWIYPSTSFSLYLLMYVLLKKRAAKTEPTTRTSRSTSGASSKKKEVMLLIQAAIICITFLLETMAFIYLRGYGYWSDFTITTLSIINSSINPVVYLIFNSTLRRKALQTLGFDKVNVIATSKISAPIGLTTAAAIQTRGMN